MGHEIATMRNMMGDECMGAFSSTALMTAGQYTQGRTGQRLHKGARQLPKIAGKGVHHARQSN
jgi:hypothetical protein